MYTAKDNKIPKGSRKTNWQTDRICATRKMATCKALLHWQGCYSDGRNCRFVRHAFQYNCWFHRPQHDSQENNWSGEDKGFSLPNSEGRLNEMEAFYRLPGAKRETKLLNEEFKAKCVVASSSNGRMNEELTFDWVRSVLGNFSFTWRILAWDSFKCHVMETIKSYARQRHIFNHPKGLYEIHWGTRRGLE